MNRRKLKKPLRQKKREIGGIIFKNPENGNCIVVTPHEPFDKEEHTAYYSTEETEENIFKVFPKSRNLLEATGTRLIIKADVVEEKIEVPQGGGYLDGEGNDIGHPVKRQYSKSCGPSGTTGI